MRKTKGVVLASSQLLHLILQDTKYGVFSSSLLGNIITVVEERTHFFVVLNRIESGMVSFY